MRPDLVSWRPTGAGERVATASHAAFRVDWRRYAGWVGGLLAFGLLIGFYSVVSAAVQRAENGREQARLVAERQIMCGTVASNASRELCAVTVAAHVPANTLLRASFQQPVPATRKRELTASLH